jgi:glutaredoxin-related protein
MSDEKPIDVDTIITELKATLSDNPECGYASRFIKSIPVDDRTYISVRIVLQKEKVDI